MGLLNDKDRVLINAVKKYASSESAQSQKIINLLKDTDTLKNYAYSLTDNEIEILKNSIGTDELLRISKIIDEVKNGE